MTLQKMESRHDVCIALDKLAIEMLCLMEEKVRQEINIENATKNASIHLAKSRYIMGQQTVSQLQLPTENSVDFSALCTVERQPAKDEETSSDHYSLDVRKSEPDSLYVNPLKWFGVLVPQNLHQAQNIYKVALEYVVEATNVQKQLESVCDAISRLKIVKEKFTPEE